MLTTLKKKIHHYLFPHETNNFRARTLHHASIIFYIFALFFFQSSVSFIKHANPQILGYATDISVEKLFSLVNQKRIEANLPPLNFSSELSTSATQKAADMFTKNYWAHVSPTGVSPWAFITSSGYNYLYAGENLAKDFNTAEEVVDAWMKSSSHRANILKSEYTDIGLAVMNGKLDNEETTLVVQHFGVREESSTTAPQGDTVSLSVIAPTPAEVVSSLTEKQEASDQNAILLGHLGVITKKGNSLLPLSISKRLSLIFAEFFLIILFIDSLYIWRYKTIRLTGHNLAHIIFFAALIGAMSATGIGVIL